MIAMPPEEIEEAINKVNKIEEKTYEYLEFRSGKRNEKIFTCKLEVGTDVECRDYILKELQANVYIQETFKLNYRVHTFNTLRKIAYRSTVNDIFKKNEIEINGL